MMKKLLSSITHKERSKYKIITLLEGIILTDFEIDKDNRNNHTEGIINLIIRE